MEVLAPPRGLIIELVTPFKRKGEIDEKGLRRLLARVSPSAHGVFLASPRAGEGATLSPALRSDLLRQTMLWMGEKNSLPIFIWVTQGTEEETRKTMLALAEAARETPYRPGIFHVDTPLFYHSNRGLPDLYREICTTAGAPLILHNDPDLIKGLARPFKRHNIRTAILKELCGFPGIAGLIFSGSLDRAHHYQRACRRRPDFRIYDGDEARFLDHPSRSGVVSGGANLAPAAWARIVASSLQPSTDGADYPDRLQQIWDTGSMLHHMRDLYADAPASIIKAVLAGMGVTQPPGQPPENIASVQIVLRQLVSQIK
ncbi:MAG: dihydrodipicolinate synthase family protein [Deltaproteobacteria bacterium]|nr:dihydrodipicolinate synthase family protein [Deltaproteobacteria bacterium]